MKRLATLLSLNLILVACGGGGDADSSAEEPAAEPAPAPAANAGPSMPGGAMTMPDWYSYDEGSNAVEITLTAGQTSRNNYWNYNGAINGEIAVTVPVGATVTINMVNNDPAMAHSVGVSREMANFAMVNPEPVFPGSITDNPQSMTQGGLPGETQTITFTPDEAGDYTLVCFVPGHSAVGMWIYFVVSAEGEAGVQGQPAA